MSLTPTTLDALKQLLTTGEVSLTKLADIPNGEVFGLWAVAADKQRAVATPAVVKLLRTLPSQAEIMAAFLSCQPDIRIAWQQIACARLQELGQQRDVAGLCEAVSTLGGAAESLLSRLPEAKLAATPFTELERIVFEVPAEQAISTPKLYRVLGATAPLVEGNQGKPAKPLPGVDTLDPSKNWLKGRLIQLPNPQAEAAQAQTQQRATSVLSGCWADYTPPEAEQRSELAPMYWVLARPWCFLLAQVVFTQEAWAAERISGELTLELDANNDELAFTPPRLDVVVTTADGAETLCGSLGELLLRVLQQLGVEILAPEIDNLDAQLASVIAALLQRQVWQYSPGAGGTRPHYSIHPAFSDTCYRALGSKYFNRLASSVTATIRSTCDQWAKERRMATRPLPASDQRVSPTKALTSYI